MKMLQAKHYESILISFYFFILKELNRLPSKATFSVNAFLRRTLNTLHTRFINFL